MPHTATIRRLATALTLPTAALLATLIPGGTVESDPVATNGEPKAAITTQDAKQLFASLTGQWTGTCTTWLQGKEFDKSKIEGTIEAVDHGPFLRHTYVGKIRGKAREGQETLAWNKVEERFESAWLDSFHMNYALMFSTGPAAKGGFTLKGSYRMVPGQDPWGWRMEWRAKGAQDGEADALTITMFNVTPSGDAEKAVETIYTRKPAEGEGDK